MRSFFKPNQHLSFFFFELSGLRTPVRIFLERQSTRKERGLISTIRGRGRRTKFRLTLLGGVTSLEN